ncbi:MAG: LysM peptidoglycan-binding domain-containing protein [Burkholderiales bacterium]|nr:LysM peptidoglycan-binding domain-containing protein [Burkholderiales bacterium]
MKHLITAVSHRRAGAIGLAAGLLIAAWPAQAQQRHSVTPTQRATAHQVAAQGVPLSALAPNAPEEYLVRRGDTLWGIAGVFLRSPWRWPELWGMNLGDIRNPHLIYPGQRLFLERVGDRALLRTHQAGAAPALETVRVSPRTRAEVLGGGPLPTLKPQLIEPFLTEPLVVDDDTFQRAPRIVALANQSRVLVAKGDRAYVRGPADAPVLKGPGLPDDFRVFRTATALKDPVSGELLGYEGQYVGQALLARGESEVDEALEVGRAPPPSLPAAGEHDPAPSTPAAPVARLLPVPATVDIIRSKEEMRPGDRLLPEPPRELRSYVPRAPDFPIEARVVLVHGSSVRYAGQNQIVVINKGLRDGVEPGHVLTLLSAGVQMVDKTDKSRERIRLPDERNGVAMVFRRFDRVSYALVMEISNPVQVGDKLVTPN